MSIRITDSYMASILVGDLNRSLGNMLEQQRMAGSMRRVNSFADDPRAVGTIQRYNALIANNDDYLSNVSRSRIIVDSTDTALQNISDVLAEARVIALRESSALATRTSRNTAVVEVDNLVNRLMDVLNTTVEGNYIFSGRQTSTRRRSCSNGGHGPLPGRRRRDVLAHRTRLHDGGQHSRQHVPGHPECHRSAAARTWPRACRPAPPLADLNLGEGWVRGSISDQRRRRQPVGDRPERGGDGRRRRRGHHHRHRRRGHGSDQRRRIGR